MGIGARLRNLRQEKNLTQKQLSEKIGISLHSINSYELERREPNAKAMVALERFFNTTGAFLRGETDEPEWGYKDFIAEIDDRLGRMASTTIEKARASDELSKKMTYNILLDLRRVLSLDASKKSAAMVLLEETNGITREFIDSCLLSVIKDAPRFEAMKRDRIQDFISALDNFEYGHHEKTPARTYFPYHIQRASAGTGQYLDDATMETVSVRIDALPKDYERDPSRYFGVIVSGDSMEPKYHDGDMLIVKDEVVQLGDVILAVVNGEGYVKQMGSGALHSLNPAYDDIPISEEGIRFAGKVVGVLSIEAMDA